MKRNEDIINWEVMGGWPEYKMNLREILATFCYMQDGELRVKVDDPILDLYPVVLDTDCMGYGINGRHIIEVGGSVKSDKPWFNIWTEYEVDNVELWRQCKFHPYASVYNKELKKDVDLKDIRKTETDTFEYLCWDITTKEEFGWFSADVLDWRKNNDE